MNAIRVSTLVMNERQVITSILLPLGSTTPLSAALELGTTVEIPVHRQLM